jgi:hypothetical protein
MIIDFGITGTIQVPGDDPQAALRNLTLLTLENLGQKNKVEFFMDGEPLGVTWDLQQNVEDVPL